MPNDEWIEQVAKSYVCGGNEPQTPHEVRAVRNIGALLLATVRKALRVERLAEIEARGAHLAEFHPDGERAELSGARICEILTSHGYHPALSIMAAVRDIITGARLAGREVRRSGMAPGHRFGVAACPDCGRDVAENWVVRHMKSGCVEACPAEAETLSLGGGWNDVVKALSELHEVYFMERLTSDVEMLEALENLMDTYVAWLD